MYTVGLECPYCKSKDVEKSTKGKVSRGLANVASVAGGTLLSLVTGLNIGGLSASVGMRVAWHQYFCKSCNNTFEIRLDSCDQIVEIRKKS